MTEISSTVLPSKFKKSPLSKNPRSKLKRVKTIKKKRSASRPHSVANEVEQLRSKNFRLSSELKEVRSLLDIAPAFFGFLSLEGVVLDLNALALQVISATKEEVAGKFFWECPWWKPLSKSAAIIRKAVADAAKGKTSKFDLEYIAVQEGVQQESWVAFSLRPLLNSKGKVTHLIATGIDISQRKKDELELSRLAEELKKFRFLSDNTHEAHFLVDSMSSIVYANKEACRALQYTESELLSLTVPEIDPLFSFERFLDFFERAQAVDSVAAFETIHRKKDGTEFPVEIMMTVLEVDGKPYSFAQVRDITERQTLQKLLAKKTVELEFSNNELERFASVVSHDLKEPLRTISMFLSLLERNHKETLDGVALEYIHFAVQGASRMEQLISGILSLSEIGAKNAQRSLTDCNAVLREALSGIKAAIEDTKAEIVSADLPILFTDPLLLRQVFQNLLSNAIKFHRPGIPPRINIEIRQRDGKPCFVISDNGVGFDSNVAINIFEPFQRFHGREVEGSGLGLATCQRAIHKLGGKIWAESSVGNGAAFFFYLPTELAPLTKNIETN